MAGIFTVTETGIAACLYSFAVSVLIYRQMTVKRFARVVVRATLSSSMIMFLIGTATVMAWLITREQVAAQAAAWFAGLSGETLAPVPWCMMVPALQRYPDRIGTSPWKKRIVRCPFCRMSMQ